MVLDENIIQYLVCPSTRMKLTLAEPALVASINARVETNTLSTVEGEILSDPVDGLLITADGQRAYPIIHGIPHLLVSSAIELS